MAKVIKLSAMVIVGAAAAAPLALTSFADARRLPDPSPETVAVQVLENDASASSSSDLTTLLAADTSDAGDVAVEVLRSTASHGEPVSILENRTRG